MLDYDSLKAMGRSIGRPVKDLLALAPNNDPFYAGVGARRCAAEWFAQIWKQHGDSGSHLRRLRTGELWQTIADEIEEQRPDLSGVEVPRSRAPGETDRFVLFDSRRDYFTQIDAYNAWRDGDENGTA
jgi:hypothetical protein